jgi:3-deoxy-D-manno-octulosonate 8-phosphate phosphatase (KDO 8-P phosphatase)
MSVGIDVVLITGRRSRVIEHRAKELGIEQVYQDISDKGALCKQLISDRGLEKQEVCCMGDDLPDLAMFSVAGICVAVADAVKEVRETADFITTSKGGFGAVREACEWILKCQGKWPV